MKNCGLFLLVCISALIQTKTIDDDKVVFPDFPSTFKFLTYSGFLTSASGKLQYHYVFVQSAGNPTTDPIIVWMNGGPGASSLIGFLTEIGPVYVESYSQSSKKIVTNEYSWNKNANLLFIETPVGVGFSKNSDDSYEYNDDTTAAGAYEALNLWFNLFSTYKGRNVYLAGESYAGMYIPYTAQAIINGNKVSVDKINLKGILIGNGRFVIDNVFETAASNKFILNRHFVDPINQYILNNQCEIFPDSVICRKGLNKFLNAVKDLNPYNIYGYCKQTTLTGSYKLQYTPWAAVGQYLDASNSGFVCVDFTQIENYFNSANVQAALKVTGTYQAINTDILYGYDINPAGSTQHLQNLIAAGIKVQLYSGDLDSVISIDNTLDTIDLLSLKETSSWTPVVDESNVIYGWSVGYQGLKLVVIRGAGHSVPLDQRKAAYDMLSVFLAN